MIYIKICVLQRLQFKLGNESQTYSQSGLVFNNG